MKKINLIFSYFLVFTIAACGGGGSNNSSTHSNPTPIPTATPMPGNTTTLLSNGAVANYSTTPQTLTPNHTNYHN